MTERKDRLPGEISVSKFLFALLAIVLAGWIVASLLGCGEGNVSMRLSIKAAPVGTVPSQSADGSVKWIDPKAVCLPAGKVCEVKP